jgi:hypothetical protein
MTAPINNASARQRIGGPSPILGRHGDGNNRAGRQHLTKVEVEITELTERSTHDLRLVWRRLHRSDPPLGLSRDLLIRVLANQLQERTHGGASAVLRRRLHNLTAGSRKSGVPLDPGIVLKTGTKLLREWRGHTHTVLVREDGFEYEGEHYRSLTVIAKRITGAHWSGPRFFGLTTRAGAVVGAEGDDAVRPWCAARTSSLRDLHPQILRGGARAGIQFAAGAARGLRGVHQQPTPRGLGVPARGF